MAPGQLAGQQGAKASPCEGRLGVGAPEHGALLGQLIQARRLHSWRTPETKKVVAQGIDNHQQYVGQILVAFVDSSP